MEVEEENSTSINDADLSHLGIRALDQSTLEKNVERKVDAALAEHKKTQQLNILNRELKEVSNDIIKGRKKALTLQQKLEGQRTRIIDPKRYSATIDEIEDCNSHISELEKRLQDINAELDESIIKPLNSDALEEGEVVEEEGEFERLVRLGEITPFATVSSASSSSYLNDPPSKKRKLTPISSQSGGNRFLPETSTKSNETVNKLADPNESSILFNLLNSSKNRKNSSSKLTSGKIVKKKARKLKSKESVISEEQLSDDGSEYLPSEEEHSDDAVNVVKERNVVTSKIKKVKSKNLNDKVVQSKDDSNQKNYKKRLENYKKNLLQKKLDRIENGEDDVEDDTKYESFAHGIKVPLEIWEKLYKYQKTGVRWMHELHSKGCGGILGDEMGLGKTVQVIAFLTGLRCAGDKNSWKRGRGLGPVLIVCPATILHQWMKHFHDWWPLFRVAIMHNSSGYEGNLDTVLYNLTKCNGIVITSYTGVRDNIECINRYNWHYVILDEGHKIRNPEAQVTVAVKKINTPHRLILSGSPIQNSLKELWSLFDFVFPGKLGTLAVFMEQFSVPITQGGYANANRVEVETGYKCAVVLRDTINPYLLRRMKADVKNHLNLPDKSEQVLFCALTKEQRQIYKEYIESDQVSRIMNGRLKVFVGLINLRKICNHPDLYTGGTRLGPGETEEEDLARRDAYGYWERSGKMQVVEGVLKLWKKQGHRVLLFTQSAQMLTILEKFLLDKNYSHLKMNGKTAVGGRQALVQKFNSDASIFVFLLTTRVGGLGVNLTGANRVVIFDPDWNPSTDTQARERAWRIGQLKNVTIYRLLTAGTIEEKIYHRQIFKQFLTNRVLKDPKQQRFFKTNDLHELFTLQNDEGETESSTIFSGTSSQPIDKRKERKEKRKISNRKFEPVQSTSKDTVDKFKIPKCNDNIEKSSYDPDILDETTNSSEVPPVSNDVLNETQEEDSSNADQVEKTEAQIKEEKMREFAKRLNKKLFGKSEEESKKEKIDKHSKKDRFDKGAKFEGSRVPGLVKKRKYKGEKKEEMEKQEKDNKKQDEYVLTRLFRNTNVHSALSHDMIVDSKDSDHHLLESEAERVAKDALKIVRQSRSKCFRPSLNGKSKRKVFGSEGSSLLGPSTSTFGPSTSASLGSKDEELNPFDDDSDDNGLSSSQLLKKINSRKQFSLETEEDDEEEEEIPVDAERNSDVEMLEDIRIFVAFQASHDGKATTQEILSRFKDKFPEEKSRIFKAMLKKVCDFSKDSEKVGWWHVKPEFR